MEALMLAQWLTRSAFFALVCGVISSAHGAVVYNESISGDFSDSGATPTVVTVGTGSNVIVGSMGDHPAGGIDLEYFSIKVPTGTVLSALVVSPDTEIGAGVSFIGMQFGAQFTVPPDTFSAAGLLGWVHYNNTDVGHDILPRMNTVVAGSTGFTIPLGPGTYSFWLQDTDGGTLKYGFDLMLSAAVPEPATYATLAVGLVFLIAGLRRRGTA
jgi:hypothetical protein